jgi:hypothetical protein
VRHSRCSAILFRIWVTTGRSVRCRQSAVNDDSQAAPRHAWPGTASRRNVCGGVRGRSDVGSLSGGQTVQAVQPSHLSRKRGEATNATPCILPCSDIVLHGRRLCAFAAITIVQEWHEAGSTTTHKCRSKGSKDSQRLTVHGVNLAAHRTHDLVLSLSRSADKYSRT